MRELCGGDTVKALLIKFLGFSLFPLQFASLEKEPFLGHILREAEVSHLARGAYLSVMAQRSLDKGKIPLHFLDASPDFEGNVFAYRNRVAITHGKVCSLSGGL